MRHYEKTLLSHLQEDNSQGKNDPLADVKNAMGEIAYVAGNPLTKTEITLNIDLFYFDSTGAVITPAFLPAFMQTSFPIYLLGLTDYYGGYVKESLLINTTPPYNGQVGLVPGVGARVYGIYYFNVLNIGFAPLVNELQYGDFIHYEVINTGLAFPLTQIITLLRIRCQNVSYGTFLNSFVSDLITISNLRLIVPVVNINQYVNPLIFGYQTLFGKTFSDSIDPRMYITSTDFQQQICDIPINLPVDKAVMLGFQMLYDCQHMSIILFVEKVESLTHKSNLNKR
jgi:hypothetical protein